MRDLYILFNDIELLSLFMYHMRHISEQLIEFADRLLDIANLRLALDDQGFLEVDLVLRCQSQLLLLLQLLPAEAVAVLGRGCGLVLESGAGG